MATTTSISPRNNTERWANTAKHINHTPNCRCMENLTLFSYGRQTTNFCPVISPVNNVANSSNSTINESVSLTLLDKLIRCASIDQLSSVNNGTNHTTTQAIELIKTYLKENIINYEQKIHQNELRIIDIINGGKNSLVIGWGKFQEDTQRLIFNGHLDVVPGLEKQYQLHVDDENDPSILIGRGTLDMHGLNVSVLESFIQSINSPQTPSGGLIIQLVADEEDGGTHGTRYLYENSKTNGLNELLDNSSERLYIVEGGGFTEKIDNEHRVLVGVGEKGAAQYDLKLKSEGFNSNGLTYRTIKLSCDNEAHAGIMLVDQNPIVDKVKNIAIYAKKNGYPITKISSEETSKSKLTSSIELKLGIPNKNIDKACADIKSIFNLDDDNIYDSKDDKNDQSDFSQSLISLGNLSHLYNELPYDWLEHIGDSLYTVGKTTPSYLFSNTFIRSSLISFLDSIKPYLLTSSFFKNRRENIIKFYQDIITVSKGNANPTCINSENDHLNVSINIRTTTRSTSNDIFEVINSLIREDNIIEEKKTIFREASETSLTDKVKDVFTRSIKDIIPEDDRVHIGKFILPGSTDGGIIREFDNDAMVFNGGFLSETTTGDVKASFHTDSEFIQIKSLESYQKFFNNLINHYLFAE